MRPDLVKVRDMSEIDLARKQSKADLRLQLFWNGF